MISTFRYQTFSVFFSIAIALCLGQLDISTGPLIEGRPAVLFCSIPNFSGAGFWNKDGFPATQCRAENGCFPETEGSLYRYSSNTSGMFLAITDISRPEQRVWICGHTGDEDVTYNINYDNVFVIPAIEDVSGIDGNVTLGNDILSLTLTFTTSCMHPQPNVKLFYTDEDGNITIRTNLDSLNTTNSVCMSPEAAHVGSITVSTNDLCGVSVLPKLSVTPEGLPFEYSTAAWISTHYIQFPDCQDTDQTTNPELITEETTITEFLSSTQSEVTPIAYQDMSGGKIELAVGISVGAVILLVIVIYLAVVVFTRNKKRENFEPFSNLESNTNSLGPSISVDPPGNDYDVEFFQPNKLTNLPSYEQTEHSVNERIISSPEINHHASQNSELVLSVQTLDSPGDHKTEKDDMDNEKLDEINNEKLMQNASDIVDSGDKVVFVLKM